MYVTAGEEAEPSPVGPHLLHNIAETALEGLREPSEG
jgi:hypothetical protein